MSAFTFSSRSEDNHTTQIKLKVLEEKMRESHASCSWNDHMAPWPNLWSNNKSMTKRSVAARCVLLMKSVAAALILCETPVHVMLKLTPCAPPHRGAEVGVAGVAGGTLDQYYGHQFYVY